MVWILVGDLVGKLRGVRVKTQEHGAQLLAGGVAEFDGHVDPARTNQRAVQFFDMVGGQKNDAAFLGCDAINGIEQAAEADFDTVILLVAGDEESVDVFDQDQRARRGFLQQIGNALVVQFWIGQ